ncbi:hypothetical protein H0H87_010940, partial [Tephrocybe sp. NHM501043]
PDLRRKALKSAMRCSPEGLSILRMGARLAVSVMAATRDLEMIVSAHNDFVQIEEDVVMVDATPESPPHPHPHLPPGLSPLETDWEMVAADSVA